MKGCVRFGTEPRSKTQLRHPSSVQLSVSPAQRGERGFLCLRQRGPPAPVTTSAMHSPCLLFPGTSRSPGPGLLFPALVVSPSLCSPPPERFPQELLDGTPVSQLPYDPYHLCLCFLFRLPVILPGCPVSENVFSLRCAGDSSVVTVSGGKVWRRGEVSCRDVDLCGLGSSCAGRHPPASIQPSLRRVAVVAPSFVL